jgi:hypothetical protein
MSLLVVFLPFGSPSNTLTDKVNKALRTFGKRDDPPNQLFEDALSLVDAKSQAKVKRFYRREDAWRTSLAFAFGNEQSCGLK